MKLIKNLFFLLFIAALALAAYFYHWTSQPVLTLAPGQETVDFMIKPGSAVRSLSRQIEAAGIPMPAYMFEALVRLSNNQNKIKAGSFEVTVNDTPLDILRKIVKGEFAQASIGIIEGWSFKQMRKAIDAQKFIRHDSLGWSDAELMKAINPEYAKPEGLFFPDTYLFFKGSSDVAIYQQAHQAMLRHLDTAWKSRPSEPKTLPYKTPYEVLIMASIIEKETGKASERPMIASVFVNRLNLGMLLQTDPTVIYGMGDAYNGKIYKRDLQTDTEFNTYTRSGLPPTPIALPGIASLKAAINPEPSNALYFVARGDGSSEFSENLTQHNRAVNKYQR